MMNEEQHVALDRMRYTKNKLSARLTLAAILFNALYFICVYKTDRSTYYYTLTIGVSIVYNLVFMLLAFMASEGVKNYRIRYAYLLIGLGVIQIARIFILPLDAHTTAVTVQGVKDLAMSTPQFVRVVIYLALSAACCLAAGVTGIKRSSVLARYMASLPEKA